MTQVLLVGYDPENVDYSNPAYPPGMSAEKINAGIALALKQMADRGWENDVCYIRPDGTAGQTVERHLASAKYDCILIGAGVRLPPQSLADFEAVITRSIGVLRLPPSPLMRFVVKDSGGQKLAAQQRRGAADRGQYSEIARATR